MVPHVPTVQARVSLPLLALIALIALLALLVVPVKLLVVVR